MSAFVCGVDHFKALAIFAVSRRGGSVTVDPRYVDGLPDETKLLSGTQLATAYANILYAENIRSCGERYPDDDVDDLPGEIHKPAQIIITGRDDCSAAYRLPAISILKMCNCLEYQSCETDDWRKTLAYVLLGDIRAAAIRVLPGYENAPWDYSVSKVAA